MIDNMIDRMRKALLSWCKVYQKAVETGGETKRIVKDLFLESYQQTVNDRFFDGLPAEYFKSAYVSLRVNELTIPGYYWWYPDLGNKWQIYIFLGRNSKGQELGGVAANNGMFVGPLIPPALPRKE